MWDSVKDISLGYIILGCFFQCLQTVFTALGWYGILRYAYPGGVHTSCRCSPRMPTGVALNNFLPANIGTFVSLLMYVAINAGRHLPRRAWPATSSRRSSTLIIGTLIYVYLFLEIAGSFEFQFGDEQGHAGRAIPTLALIHHRPAGSC